MIYLHRGKIDEKLGSQYLPIDYDYMGSTEFELGGIGQTFSHLAQASALESVKCYWEKGGGHNELFILGADRESVEKTQRQLVAYQTGALRSKEFINFGTGGYGRHDFGVDIVNHTLICPYPEFLCFIEEVLKNGGIKGRETTNVDFRIGDPVFVYDIHKAKLRSLTVKGIPQDVEYVTVWDGKRRKFHTHVRNVVRVKKG